MQVDHHDPENTSLLRFNAMWESIYRHDSLLVFSTGRSPTLYEQLRKEKPLLTPDITIMSVGTEITYGDSMVPDEGWEVVLNKAWNRNIVLEEAGKFPQLKLQVTFDISWICDMRYINYGMRHSMIDFYAFILTFSQKRSRGHTRSASTWIKGMLKRF